MDAYYLFSGLIYHFYHIFIKDFFCDIWEPTQTGVLICQTRNHYRFTEKRKLFVVKLKPFQFCCLD